jgi:ComF family protein
MFLLKKRKTGFKMPLWYDFVSLIFPRVCESCGNTLLKHERCICAFCLHHLPRTDFHLHADNPLSRIFWGRVNIQSATALYYFHKGNHVQHLVHGLKYKGKQDIGVFLGTIYGEELKKTKLFGDISLIVPVPLHPKKKRKRGYNQSELFARGLSKTMKVEIDTTTLIRTIATQTQTRKSRFKRWENVKEVFVLTDEKRYQNKHILLVDDVVTTGATLEACANIILKSPGTRVSIATIACAIK